MKKLIILFLAVPCFASGPKYVGSKTDPAVYQEFGNVYHDIQHPVGQIPAKFWVNFVDNAGTVSISASYNVASVTRTAPGQYTINLGAGFSTANWVVSGLAKDAGSGAASLVIVEGLTTTTASIITVNPTNLVAANTAGCYIVGFGT